MNKELGPIGSAIKNAHCDRYRDGLLDTREAAFVLRLAPATLMTWRSKGCGPAFIKYGPRIFYRLDDLAAWADSNTVEFKQHPINNKEAAHG